MKKVVETNRPKRKIRPATSPEARENQLIALAMDLAEERLLNGTATSQEVCHFLKLGSTKEKLDKEIMTLQKELIAAKTDSLKGSKRIEELYEKAIISIKEYQGVNNDTDVYGDDQPTDF